MRRRITALLGASAIALTGIGFAFAPAAKADTTSDAAAFVSAINQLRASKGLKALIVDSRLVPVAQNWSARMAAAGTISHNPNLTTQAPSDWTYLGENVGMGPDVPTLQTAFTNSPEHYANMVDVNYNAIGVAVTIAPNGTMFVTEDYEYSPSVPYSVAQLVATTNTNPNPTQGYYLAGSDGNVYAYGTARNYGSASGVHLAAPVVGMASTPDLGGYWLLGGDGGIFSYGDAAFHGSTGALHLAAPVIGMASTPDGAGYWLVARDGGIFSFGDAVFHGSTGALHLNAPIVGMAPTPDGRGYWLVARDGGIFSFGDATFHGSTGGMRLNAPIVGMAPTSDGQGYWLVAQDGGIFCFGDAVFHGSAGGSHLTAPIQGIVASHDGGGYFLVAGDGGVFTYGDAEYDGSPAGYPLPAPIVSIGR